MLSGYDTALPVAGAAGVGASAYQIWLARPGNAGRGEDDFLASLKGADGLIRSIAGVSQPNLTAADLVAILTAVFDALPPLPADLGAAPAGGLFRDGDANGYRLVRLYPAS